VELLLVRHAESTADVRGRCYGQLDVELSEFGRGQCRHLAEALSGEPVQALVSSRLARARATADAIAEPHGLDVVVLDDLRELDFGELEGLPYDEIAASRPELYARWMNAPTTVRFPGGESYEDLRRRAARAVERWRATHDGQVVVAVTHAGFIRAVLSDALGLPPDRLFRIAVDPASVTRIGWIESEPIVRSVNVVNT
jgi:alpha-ribazole phosphatase/probable phosphoglycerate mutase